MAILGASVAANLFEGSDPTGTRVRIDRVPFEIVGVAAAKGLDMNGIDQDDVVYVPLATAMRRLMNQTHLSAVYAQATATDTLRSAEDEIRELLRRRHRLGDAPDDFTIKNQATLLAAHEETTRSMTLLIGSAAVITLAVGGVGILAVMLMSVGERRREIGLRRALGARRRDILAQFVVESALLSGAGGALGAAFGAGISVMLPFLLETPAAPSWPVGAAALALSVALGVASGVYPALRASSLEPTEALRSK
jgi:putative ABC transport system permease protein